jgi:hypothetical protein
MDTHMSIITVVEDGEEIRLGCFAELAPQLGVTINQVWTWYRRRERNGFPAPHSHHRASNGAPNAPHFDIDAVRVWLLYYTPNPGGSPRHKRSLSVGEP